jgi:co-chaperonin GroES (HSP10)
MRLLPLPGRILVEEDPFKYEGLIAIPDKAKRRPTTGYVRDIGAGVTRVKVNQHILYAQFSGTGIALKNQPMYRVLGEDEVLLILEGDIEVEEISA